MIRESQVPIPEDQNGCQVTILITSITRGGVCLQKKGACGCKAPDQDFGMLEDRAVTPRPRKTTIVAETSGSVVTESLFHNHGSNSFVLLNY